MTYIALIQARLGSTRLPMKSLLTFHGKAVIDWVVSRVSQAKRISSLCVAIPDTPLDAVLYKHLKDHGIPCMQGAENDVLDRFCQAVKKTSASHIIRVCADNPFIWGEAIDRLIQNYEATRPDYAYNHIPRNNLWPDGLGAEVLSRELLEELNQKATKPSQREHCLNYIWDNQEDFRIHTFDPEEPWLCRPDIKLDIDTIDDFTRLSLLPIQAKTAMEEILEIASTTARRT